MLKSAASENTRLVLATNGDVSSLTKEATSKCQDLIIRSVSRKFGELPDEVLNLERFEGFEGRVRTERCSVSGFDVWALRFSEPDKSAPGRDWVVDLATFSSKERTILSCRLGCYSATQNFDFSPSTPGALKEIVGAVNFQNFGYTFPPHALEIGVDESVGRVIQQIQDIRRWWNVVVVADSDDPRHGFDADEIQRTVMGCAVVFSFACQNGTRVFRADWERLSSFWRRCPNLPPWLLGYGCA